MQITINRNGENHGPYSPEQVRQMLEAGQLTRPHLEHPPRPRQQVLHRHPSALGIRLPPHPLPQRLPRRLLLNKRLRHTPPSPGR